MLGWRQDHKVIAMVADWAVADSQIADDLLFAD